jgi:hypothetical protein
MNVFLTGDTRSQSRVIRDQNTNVGHGGRNDLPTHIIDP